MRSKRYQEAAKQVVAKQLYTLAEGITLAKKTATTKFDSSIELHAKLGINPKDASQIVRGASMLPHGTGKKLRIAVFAEGQEAKAAKEIGADPVGGDELIGEIAQTKKCAFDIAVATPAMMKKLAKIARVLGQKGLMPNPRNDTVTANPAKTVQELLSGKITFRNDDSGNVHQAIGKASWEEKRIIENAETLLAALRRARPSSTKGTYLRSVVIKSTMGPAIRVSV